jgi:circadian clock protein KaiB
LKLDKPLFPQLFKGIAMFTPGGDLIYSIDPSKQGHWHLHLCTALQEMLGLPEPPHFLVPGYTAAIDRWRDPRTQQLRISAEIYRPVRHHQSLLNAVFGTGNLVWQVAPWQEGSCDPIVLETYRHQFPQLWEDHDLIVRFDLTKRFSHAFKEGYPILEEPRRGTGMFTHRTHTGDLLYPSRRASPIENTYPAGTPTPLENTPPMEYGEPSTINTNAEGVTSEAAAQWSLNEPIEPDSSASLTVSPSDSEEIGDRAQPLVAQGYVLRLFVSGHSPATENTLKSLHQLLEDSLRHPYTLKVIDVFKHPDQAEVNQISATPTLLRVWPGPVRRLVGDLTDIERVLRILATPEA